MAKGIIYLVPTTLGGESIQDLVPEDVRKAVIELRYFIVEDIKSARRFLRKLDREFPIDDSTFFILNKKMGETIQYIFEHTSIPFKKYLILPKHTRDQKQWDLPFTNGFNIMHPELILYKKNNFGVNNIQKTSCISFGIKRQIANVICQCIVFSYFISI